MILEHVEFRTYEFESLETGNKATAKLPCFEEKIQQICDELGDFNRANTKVLVKSVDDKQFNPIIAKNAIVLDELNYLEQRLDNLQPEELQTFYATAEAKSYQSCYDLINLTFNLHCYSLIDSSKDSVVLGRELFQKEQLLYTKQEVNWLNSEKYLADLMNRGKPWETSLGLLYPNKNNPTTVDDGENFPLYSHGSSCIEVTLRYQDPKNKTRSELLYLPYTGSDLNKIMERMGTTNRNKVRVTDIHVIIPKKYNVLNDLDLSQIRTADDLDALSELAEYYERTNCHTSYDLKFYVEQLEIVTVEQVNQVSAALLSKELEFIPHVSTPQEYGHFLFSEQQATRNEPEFTPFMDFEGYGNSKLEGKTVVTSDQGMMIYGEDSVCMVQLLENFEQEQADTQMMM